MNPVAPAHAVSATVVMGGAQAAIAAAGAPAIIVGTGIAAAIFCGTYLYFRNERSPARLAAR